MSRVYEALKKAERLRATDESQSPITSSDRPPGPTLRNGALAHLGPPTEQLRPRIDPTKSWSFSRVREETEAHSIMPEFPASDGRGPLLLQRHSDHAGAAEPFHVLALGVQTWAIQNKKRSITVTSALSGEGKSFIALNLAASLSLLGCGVLLVDADLRKPSLHHSFNIAPVRGLVDYLEGNCKFEECLHPTSLPGLVLVPAGGRSHAPAELLARPTAREFVRQAHALIPERFLIIDSPAASIVPEPQMLTSLTEAILFVVAANRTPRDVVKHALESSKGAPLYGVVLNRFEAPLSATLRYPTDYRLQRSRTLG